MGIGKGDSYDDLDDEKRAFEMKVRKQMEKEKMDWRCYWDKFGIMRREKAPLRRDESGFKHKPLRELNTMRTKDQMFFDQEDEVYLINLAWLNQWLRFAVHGASTPGPIKNIALVTAKTKKFKKKAKYNLHWRPVSKDVWDFLYTGIGGAGGGGYGGGPAIKFTYKGDAPLVGKNDIAEYMTKTKVFKIAEVDFDTPEIVEEEEPKEEPEEPPRESLVVRESGVFPPKRFDGSPPPYENALAEAAQERRSNSGEAGPTGSLLNPLHSSTSSASEQGGSVSPMHVGSEEKGMVLSMDSSIASAPAPPSDDEGGLSDDEDDGDFREAVASSISPSAAAALRANESDDEDDDFVQAGPAVSPAAAAAPRVEESDLLGLNSPAPTPTGAAPHAHHGAGADIDDEDLLGLEDDLDLDDDDDMGGFSDASAPVSHPSLEIAEHELDDI
jgi:hypothetical protein